MARILSIEDDPDMQHLIGQVLFGKGYDIHYAWNGREGYEKVLELEPDLILLDLMLPLWNGVEVLRKLKESKPTQDIPVIVVTAYGDEAKMLKYSIEALGAVAYLRKPISVNELSGLIKRVLAHARPDPAPPERPGLEELLKGAVRADPKFMTVWIEDRLIATLTQKEFVLLRGLMSNPGAVADAVLLRDLGYEDHQRDALKQVVHRLRNAFGALERRRIKTTPEGYELIG